MNTKNKALEKFDELMISERQSLPDGIEVLSARDIKPEPISWLWRDWLARGKVHLLAGLPGQGKTTIAMSLCATVSGGGAWPDGTVCEPGNVLIWSAEDDLSDILAPRLKAAGHLDRCYFITGTRKNGELRSFDPAKDMKEIERYVQVIGDVKLLVLDPIVTIVAGDSNNNTDVRRGLQPLVDFAMRWDTAVLGLTHLSKGSTVVDPALRVIGSVGFIAVARAVFLAQKLPRGNGTEKGIFVKAKANAAASDGGFAYEIEQVDLGQSIETTRILWGEPLKGSALELLEMVSDSNQDRAENALLESLRTILKNGPVPAGTVFESLSGCGFSVGQIKRASVKLEVKKDKQGMVGPWVWSLPKLTTDEAL